MVFSDRELEVLLALVRDKYFFMAKVVCLELDDESLSVDMEELRKLDEKLGGLRV